MSKRELYEREREWIFTFGCGQGDLAGKCIRIKGAYEEAREKMCEMFGNKWAFQYPASEWDEEKNNPKRAWLMEEEITI